MATIKRDGTPAQPGERHQLMHTFRAARDDNDHRPDSPRAMPPGMRLIADYTVTEIWESKSTFTLPAGTKIKAVCRGVDMHTPLYAVDSVALLMELSGNTHDPKYRYCFVPPELVENKET